MYVEVIIELISQSQKLISQSSRHYSMDPIFVPPPPIFSTTTRARHDAPKPCVRAHVRMHSQPKSKIPLLHPVAEPTHQKHTLKLKTRSHEPKNENKKS